ncbi:esterase of the alpha-beta hydrolase superfamily [Legionella beliardensis]|uniref:Esterase of the alpha-beta hydrolase superfamily n=1 Tax=Legionella beliardensis TaxID=91822 RepID=A0A378I2L2_9GAMM|nr:Dot/Icm T4SS effector VpdC [Legionella beliardensis]STX28941.1 esterase of the alpha-beta hydrolase superfamily [Legionella beliardensis]
MGKGHVLSELLQQNGIKNPNSVLLKKYLLCVYFGRFRINGLSPDQQFSLSDYLLDEERVIFDFTHLSKQKKDEFLNWFLEAHQKNAQRFFLSDATTNDYRGYTAEVGLSWWGRITNLLFRRKKSYKWHLAPFELTNDYQLNSIEISEGEYGLLIGLNQHATENTANKYHLDNDNQDKPLRNTKRVFFTDALVKQLMLSDLDSFDYSEIVSNPHPFAIRVISQEQRLKAMHEHRQVQGLIYTLSWHARLWRWFITWFQPLAIKPEIKQQEQKVSFKEPQLLTIKGNVQVYQRPDNGEILITEKRPDLDTFVFCGGGVKFFAHLGAYKAFEDAKIKPKKFAGSSAGAIMAILCYLGYSSTEIYEFFKNFRQEHLIFYDIDRYGISDTRALKAALDFMIVKKVNHIIASHDLDQTSEGQQFLVNHVFKDGKITFESLKNLKNAYPNCGLGDELIVTATNIKKRETRYFSYTLTPAMEISEAGAISASFPVVFKPTVFEGEQYNDGGILNNLPTEVFSDDYSTFLESQYNNCLSLVAFQFDNGYERGILDTFLTRVYRENFVLNWIYGFLTGVKDPVSAWERERIKLRNYGSQVVLISPADISSTQFNIDAHGQALLFENGYQAGKNYINARYQQQNDASYSALNEEHLFLTFANSQEAMYYSCYRGRKDWFEYFARRSLLEGSTEYAVNQLRIRYFNESISDLTDENKNGIVAESNSFTSIEDLSINRILFAAIYPIFLKLPCNFINNAFDLKLYRWARHSFSIREPLGCLEYLEKLQGETHLLINLLVHLLKDFKAALIDIDTLCRKLTVFESLISSENKLHDPSFYAAWPTLTQTKTILEDFEKIDWPLLADFCRNIKKPEKSVVTSSILSANDKINDKKAELNLFKRAANEEPEGMVIQSIH